MIMIGIGGDVDDDSDGVADCPAMSLVLVGRVELVDQLVSTHGDSDGKPFWSFEDVGKAWSRQWWGGWRGNLIIIIIIVNLLLIAIINNIIIIKT